MKTRISIFLLLAVSLTLGSCAGLKSSKKPQLRDSNTFVVKGVSSDETYGYTEENPVCVGGRLQEGARNEHRYLNALAGPNGEEITYKRLGSCCIFPTPNGMDGAGLLDKYEVRWKGKKVMIYINMYDYKPFMAPKGMSVRR